MRIAIYCSGLILLAGCSTSSYEQAYVQKAAVPISTGPFSPAENQHRAKIEEALGVKHSASPVAGSLQPAQLTSMVRPRYPAVARAAGKEGSVTIAIIIGADGSVMDAKLVDATDPIFVEPAIKAVKQWKFRPAAIDGQPVNISTSVPVVFSLK